MKLNFVRDKTELGLEVILEDIKLIYSIRRGRNIYQSVASKDNTKDVIEVLAKYVGCN